MTWWHIITSIAILWGCLAVYMSRRFHRHHWVVCVLVGVLNAAVWPVAMVCAARDVIIAWRRERKKWKGL